MPLSRLAGHFTRVLLAAEGVLAESALAPAILLLSADLLRALPWGVGLLAASAMALVSWYLLLYACNHPSFEYGVTWFSASGINVGMGIIFDRLSSGMLAVVTTVSLLVQIYSLGYMGEDPGKARYYAFLSLFSWAMCGFVMASNILVGYIFWELVGLASYLLIGFWYEKNFEKGTTGDAAKKAFVVNRIGDFGFLLGIRQGHCLGQAEMHRASIPGTQEGFVDEFVIGMEEIQKTCETSVQRWSETRCKTRES